MSSMFKRWNMGKTGPRNISDEVAAEYGLKKNSRQRYRAARKEEFLRKKRGIHECFMFEGGSHHIHPTVKSELGEGRFTVIKRLDGK